MGLAVAFVAHKLYHLTNEKDSKKINRIVITAAIVGCLVNVITEPLIRFGFKYYILGIPQQIAYLSAINCAVSMHHKLWAEEDYPPELTWQKDLI